MKYEINEVRLGSLLSILMIISTSLIQIFYTPIYMRYLGVNDYGINMLAQSIVGYIAMLNLGLGNVILRYTIKYRVEGKIENEAKLNGTFFIILLLLTVIATLVSGYIYIKIPYFFKDKLSIEQLLKLKRVFILVSINLLVSFPLTIFNINISSREKFVFTRLVRLVISFLYPILAIFFMKKGYGLVEITFLSLAINMLGNIFDIYYSIKLGLKVKFEKIENKVLKEIFIYSIFIFFNVIIDRIFWGTDGIIIGKYIGTSAVAVYSIGTTFNTIYMNFSMAISNVLSPKINRLVSEGKDDEVNNLFIRVGRVQYILLGLVSSGFLIFGKEFIYLWLGEGYDKAYVVGNLIMIPMTILLIQNTAISIIQAKNKHRFRSVLYLILAIFNLGLSLILVRKYGILGCAIATSISLVLGQLVIMNFYYYKIIKLDIIKFWKNIFSLTGPIFVLGGIFYIANFYRNTINLLEFLIKVIVYSSLYIIILWVLKLNIFEKNIIINPLNRFMIMGSKKFNKKNT